MLGAIFLPTSYEYHRQARLKCLKDCKWPPGVSAYANPWFRLVSSALTEIILLHTYTLLSG